MKVKKKKKSWHVYNNKKANKEVMKRESERRKKKRKAIRKYKYKYKCNSVVSLVKGKTRCAFAVLVLTSLLQSAFLLYMYKTEQL